MNMACFQGPAQWFIRAQYVLLATKLIHSYRTHSRCQWAKIFVVRKIQAKVAHNLELPIILSSEV